MAKITKESYLGTRVSSETYHAFKLKAGDYGPPSQVLRELIEAFVEGRCKISKPSTPTPLEKLYE